MVTTTYTDDSGAPKKTTISLLPGMESYSCTKEEALREIAASNIDLGIDSLVKVGKIDKAYDAKQATFVVTAKDFDPTTVFPNFASQELKAGSPGTWTLKLTSVDPGTAGSEPAPEAKYLSSSRHVDLDDPLIVKLAGEIAPGETDPAKIAIAAETYVHKYLNLKNYSTAMATASEVAASRSGDCTEHGVLLTALLRVRKIPSRVVVGLVYVPSLQAFGGHMWTEAFVNGRWAAIDATLARGRGDAMHIKTADSALENSGALPIESFLPLIHSMGRMTVKVDSVE
jgi:transglutaminase-like putative cysteine protease